jgi:predicted nucleotidyltransferase
MPRDSLSQQERDAVQDFVRLLLERFGHQLVDVLLFGSKARGESHPGSDVDVLVILDHPDAQSLGEVRGLGFDIWLLHRVFLSIRATSRQNWQALAAMQSLFYRSVLRDGVSWLPAPT